MYIIWQNLIACSSTTYAIGLPGQIKQVLANADSFNFNQVTAKWFRGPSGYNWPELTRQRYLVESYPTAEFSFTDLRSTQSFKVEYILFSYYVTLTKVPGLNNVNLNIRYFSWYKALTYCRQQKGHLPAIRSRKEQMNTVHLMRVSEEFAPSEVLLIGLKNKVSFGFSKELCP